MRENFDKNVLTVWKGKVPIELSKLSEGNLAIMGASALIWQELNKQ